MFEIILYEPEIPPNTGNVMRLTANLGARLHLIEPLGFSLDDRQLRRAGLDYREWADVRVHASLGACLDTLASPRLLAVSTRGRQPYVALEFQPGDAFLFGPETRGLPERVLESVPEEQRLHIPMRPGNRSLNLSNAVAVVLYEAWRQQGFAGDCG
ncbi:tRNA (cytidine(34)-2'-O)-methyltransferase [Allochromatium palmeri]|uniref:tRNA (cytidine(34)-2'-O)-methyltransferase n=1 Tax=Allochromatium palmeri TaxID=231048 RepID=A0A6N8EAV2_9GAMM|nr:tRNA (cytidine(34)-2'-O)-methyltransferase [Allochromatium palmeri]MTW20468.1 tRNA (uridine(34)/cytosine(34)/5-carboxymethylaminomethyluridine(34)-2'-O)-methyltransferase TrmL [Allochromatium palmeri]